MPARKSKADGKPKAETGNPADLFLADDEAGRAATLQGQTAMWILERKMSSPGQDRHLALHMLRAAARRCPNAAYNLGNMLQEWPAAGRRSKRTGMAMTLFGFAAELGLTRLRNADEPSSAAPDDEYWLRDVVSRSLTNIGAAVANAGAPKDAVSYFERAIAVFDGNANAHACYGNMGVHHWEETDITPREGIKAWERAAALGDYCHESENGCPCRANVIFIFRKLEAGHGTDEAEDWLTQRYPGLSIRRSSSDLTTPFMEAGEISARTGLRWPGRAVQAANIFGESDILSVMKDSPLEVKVTLSGCILAAMARLDGSRSAAHVVDQAVGDMENIEALRPFLGDEEWETVGPPKTFYLMEEDVKRRLTMMAKHLRREIETRIPGLTAEEGVKGFLFHIDPGFRNGVSSMIETTLRTTPEDFDVYVPAMEIGDQRGLPN